ncbi:MAG: septum formation protein Maf [Ktedonobacteraceae bacterium]|nr:septum formation protein Maf [Ktedonobacteraceae bacterium]
MTTIQPHLLLASASPRRREIITKIGLPCAVAIAPTDEDAAQARYQGPIEELGLWTAHHKAMAALTLPEAAHRLVITADTTVLLDGTELGKPRDEAHARELLLALRGRWHHVVTGVVVCTTMSGELQIRAALRDTPVLMRPYSEQEVDAYIATRDPLDKAGAYAIQHPSFQPTERIAGCYLNVVGLPLCVLVGLLAEFDVCPAAQGCKGTACPWSERCLP